MRTLFFVILSFTCLFANAQLLTEDFSSASLPTAWGQEDNHSYNWMTDWYWEFTNGEMQHIFYNGSGYEAANAWVFTSDIAMTADNTYRIEFNINTNSDGFGLFGPAYLEVTVGQGKNSGAQTTTLWSDANITNASFAAKSFDFICPASGNYNFAFHCLTPKGGSLNLGASTYIDDVVISEVGPELNDQTDFLDFSLENETAPATINAVNHTITIEVTHGTELTSLSPIFTLSSGATADILGTIQVSGTSTNDYSSDVTYTVNAENTIAFQDWTVSVLEQAYQGCANESNIYGFTYNGENYEIIKEAKTWIDAAECAVERGGYLAQVSSLEEQNAIYDAIINGASVSPTYVTINNGGGIAYVWIGATDSNAEGTWLWDGSNSSSGYNFWNGQGENGSGNGASVNDAYYNWGGTNAGTTQEPDNYGNNQDFAAIALAGWPSGTTALGIAGEWNDIIGTSQLYYVVEYTLTTSIEIENKSEIKIYPNPTQGIVNISGSGINSIDIFNVVGQNVFEKDFVNDNSSNIEHILINDLKVGVYLVKIETENKIEVRKLIIEK